MEQTDKAQLGSTGMPQLSKALWVCVVYLSTFEAAHTPFWAASMTTIHCTVPTVEEIIHVIMSILCVITVQEIINITVFLNTTKYSYVEYNSKNRMLQSSPFMIGVTAIHFEVQYRRKDGRVSLVDSGVSSLSEQAPVSYADRPPSAMNRRAPGNNKNIIQTQK